MTRTIRRPAAPPAARRGVALLVALGVLVVLSLLGSVFATLSGIERSVARNYLDKVRARLLAESGVEQAFAELGPNHGRALDIWSATGPLRWMYYGNDLNGDGVVNAGESGAYSIALPSGEVLHDWARVPLETAARPSFPLDRNGNGLFDAGDSVTVEGRPVALSGCTGVGSYAPGGNHYALKVQDLQGRININNRHTHLVTILDNLGKRLVPPLPDLGAKVLAERAKLVPDQRFTQLDQLVPALGRTAVERLRPCLTVRGWVDDRAVKPAGLAAGKRRRDLAVGSSVYATRELRLKAFSDPPATPETVTDDFEPRSPVNINTAPYEVLCALFEGLQGCFTREIPNAETNDYTMTRWTQLFTGSDPRTSGQVGIVYQTPPVGPKTAEAIAREILKARILFAGAAPLPADPRCCFRSRQQLVDFIDRLPDGVFDPSETPDPTLLTPPSLPPDLFPASEKYIRAVMKDVLKAALDPNCHLNELNPDEVLALRVDKTDLRFWTFEACFIPLGYFAIESLGRVVDGAGREIASERLVVEAKLFDLLYDTTQADFQRDVWQSGASDGLVHLAAYPEPALSRDALRHVAYDGYLALKPKENLPGGGGASLRARFREGFDAEPNAVSGGAVVLDPGGGPWLDRLVGGAQAGSLLVDGVLSEKDSAPGYHNSYFNQHCGTLSLWVKPAFEPEYAGKDRLFWSVTMYDLANDMGSDWTTNLFGLGFLAHHGLSTANNKKETHAQAAYGSGNGSFFWRGLVGGYSGAYRRRIPTWLNQAAIDSATISGDRTGMGIMCDRIALNASPTLNHAGHNHGGTSDDPCEFYTKGVDNTYTWGNLLKRGRWVQLGMYWNDTISGDGRIRIYLNGVAVPWLNTSESGQNFNASKVYINLNCVWGPPFGPVGPDGAQQFATTLPPSSGFGLPPEIPASDKLDWSDPEMAPYGGGLGKGLPNPPPVRLGACAIAPRRSRWGMAKERNSDRYCTNTPADATVDEVFTWDNRDMFASFQSIWKEGRFHRSYGAPDKGTAAGSELASVTSARFDLQPSVARSLPPRGTAPVPGPATPIPAVPAAFAAPGRVRLGLVAYTLRVPDYARLAEAFPDAPKSPTTGRPLYPPEGVPVPRVYADLLADDGATRTSLLTGPAVLGYTATDALAKEAFARGGGPVTADATLGGGPVEIDTTRGLRYRLWIDSGFPSDAARLNAPYTASPVLDDVIVTYARLRPEILSWIVGD
jgi:hypothetical protein